MAAHAAPDLGDPDPRSWEAGYEPRSIDAMLLLADDDEGYVAREARRLIDALEAAQCVVTRVERGSALRNDADEGIEHFGYVDGRSQPLFLTTDFSGLVDGAVGPATREAGGGPVDRWNPFAPLALVLTPDVLAQSPDCLGSYFVFRKLEQNVRDFTIEEQRLADALGLADEERERAGAMAVGRFRDGTPLALHQTDGLVPPKENNFRYDLDDRDGLKCPFHAHIRKTNPRGDIKAHLLPPDASAELQAAADADERARRIARRGITYGTRHRHPNAFQALDDLPARGVGLLFMCFQASIRRQFAFMQRGWANSNGFVRQDPPTGLDPIIGQPDRDDPAGPVIPPAPQRWRPEYDKPDGREVAAEFARFVTMRGGEFFFAPSIPFLQNPTPAQKPKPAPR
jgi:Dyp-type peroxidase family